MQSIYAIILFITFMIYVLFGIYSVTRNINNKMNLMFFMICFSIAIWSYGFAISNSLNNYEEVLFWRQFSAIGWGTTFSFILHFVLILTGANRILKHKWVLSAIYLPSVVTVVVFNVYSKIADIQYQLVLTETGWGNIPLNNFWDIFYNVYYLGFSLIALALVYKWYKSNDSKVIKKQALALMGGFLVAIILGSISEMLLNSLLNIKIPSVAPIVILIPIASIYYSVIKLGLMNKPVKNERVIAFSILNNDRQLDYIIYIALVYFLGAALNIIQFYFFDFELFETFYWSTILVVIGSFIFIIPHLKLNGKMENLILSIAIAGSIPVIMIGISGSYATNVAWPIPILFMLFAIVFNNKRMLILVSLSSLMSGMYLWYTSEVTMLQIGNFDYIIRINIYILCIIFASYINGIYVKRLHENDKQVVYQKMVSEISTDFITVTKDNSHRKMENLMKKCCDFLLADRGYIGVCVSEHKGASLTYKWQKDKQETDIEEHLFLDMTSVPWIRNQLLSNQIVHLSAANLNDENFLMEKQLMDSHHMGSLVYVPISQNDVVIGFVGFDHYSDQLQLHEEDGALLRVLANIVGDGMAKIDFESELNYLAYYDVLTRLPNRTLFSDRLIEAINLANQTNSQIGIILIDLDGFKSINDTLGHESGDELLRKVAQKLGQCMEPGDIVSRFGGDEFLIMIPNVSELRVIKEAAQRIMDIFQLSFFIKKQEFFITTSAGIAIFPQDGTETNTLIKNADLAMYNAKKQGKNQFIYYSDKMNDDIIQKMSITNSLYKALEQEEFELLYQPRMSTYDNTITGLEVCVRWQHPDLGLVPPEVFVPLAEQNGSIHAIGQWVIMKAANQNKMWQQKGLQPVPISINVSIAQFKSGNFINMVKNCIEEIGLEPQYLEFQINESGAMKESANLVQGLHDLKALGVSITLDDFSKEYSSLSKLKDLPIDRLKIEKEFIKGISINSIDDSIISVIIYLAKSLDLKITAGGVDTQMQLDFLKELACDEVQGALFYEPVSKEVVERALGGFSNSI